MSQRYLPIGLALAALALPALAQDAGGDWDLLEDAARGLTLATLEYEGAPALAVRCLNGELTVMATGLPAAQSSNTPMDMVVDGRSAGAFWRPVGDGRSVYHAAPEIAARDLRRGGALILTTPGESGPARRYRLTTPTASAAVTRVIEACGKPTVDPRDDLRRLDPTTINWTSHGRGEFPPTAAANGVQAGEVVRSCIVTDQGQLQDCRIESEIPAGQGFGQAALDSRVGAQMVVPAEGIPPGGALLINLVRFRVE